MPVSLRRPLTALLPFVATLLLGMVMLSLARLGLAIWHADAVTAVDGWRWVMLFGLRVDLATMCMLLAPVAALYLLLPARLARQHGLQWLLAAWLSLALALPFLLELATPGFMSEYGLRPNRLFIEYLLYPKEVASTLLKGHLGSVLISTLLGAAAFYLGWRWNRALLRRAPSRPGGWFVRVAVVALVLVLGTLGIRSTLGHRPMNPAMAAFSGDATVNVLPLNSFYSVAWAVRDWLQIGRAHV